MTSQERLHLRILRPQMGDLDQLVQIAGEVIREDDERKVVAVWIAIPRGVRASPAQKTSHLRHIRIREPAGGDRLEQQINPFKGGLARLGYHPALVKDMAAEKSEALGDVVNLAEFELQVPGGGGLKAFARACLVFTAAAFDDVRIAKPSTHTMATTPSASR